MPQLIVLSDIIVESDKSTGPCTPIPLTSFYIDDNFVNNFEGYILKRNCSKEYDR